MEEEYNKHVPGNERQAKHICQYISSGIGCLQTITTVCAFLLHSVFFNHECWWFDLFFQFRQFDDLKKEDVFHNNELVSQLLCVCDYTFCVAVTSKFQ